MTRTKYLRQLVILLLFHLTKSTVGDACIYYFQLSYLIETISMHGHLEQSTSFFYLFIKIAREEKKRTLKKKKDKFCYLLVC